eukprot:gene13407-19259_t
MLCGPRCQHVDPDASMLCGSRCQHVDPDASMLCGPSHILSAYKGNLGLHPQTDKCEYVHVVGSGAKPVTQGNS